MLGLNEVLRVVVSYFEGLTGGGNGLSLPTLHASVPIYYAMGLVAVRGDRAHLRASSPRASACAS